MSLHRGVRLQVESRVARAHQQLFHAYQLCATATPLEGVGADLEQVTRELERIQEALLKLP